MEATQQQPVHHGVQVHRCCWGVRDAPERSARRSGPQICRCCATAGLCGDLELVGGIGRPDDLHRVAGLPLGEQIRRGEVCLAPKAMGPGGLSAWVWPIAALNFSASVLPRGLDTRR